MVGLPEKIRFVGGDRIDHENHLFFHALIGKQIVAVFAERIDVALLHPFPEAAFEKRFFGWRQMNAVLLMNELAHPNKIMIGELFFG
jgi:hypothetical protein